MQAERNALNNSVFPKLRVLCNKYGARFQAIDLRWGINEETSLNQQTMKICLNELQRCQRITPHPNFIVLLGDRYGWCPLPYEIKSYDYEKIVNYLQKCDSESLELLNEWYLVDNNNVPPVYCLKARTGIFHDNTEWQRIETKLHDAIQAVVDQCSFEEHETVLYTRSATEQEVYFGALRVSNKVYGFFREFTGVDSNLMTPDYFDLDEEGHISEIARRHLLALKKQLAEHLEQQNLFEYQVVWANTGSEDTYLAQFCQDVFMVLSTAIENEMGQLESMDEFDQEILAHKNLGVELIQNFVGREKYIEKIISYLLDESSYPLIIVGESGTGKSALLASASNIIEKDCTIQASIIKRFIGATPLSYNSEDLLYHIVGELRRIIDEEDDDIPYDYSDLITDFHTRINNQLKSSVFCFIDGMDQIDNIEKSITTSWIPTNLPCNFKLIISSQENYWTKRIRLKLPKEAILELNDMSEAELAEMLNRHLLSRSRCLQPSQQTLVLDALIKYPLPLYADLVITEALKWGSDYKPFEPLPDIVGVIQRMVTQWIDDHGLVLVSTFIGIIMASRSGLTEEEILDALSIHPIVYEEFLSRAHHIPPKKQLPVVIWARLYQDLQQYLGEKWVNNTETIVFRHRLVETIIFEKYICDIKPYAKHLSELFLLQPLYDEELAKEPNERKIAELPYVLTFSERWSDLFAILTDIDFIQAKINIGMIGFLVSDFTRALENYQTKDISRKVAEEIYRFLKRNFIILSRHPEGLLTEALKEPDYLAPYLLVKDYIESHRIPTIFLLDKPAKEDLLNTVIPGYAESVIFCKWSPDSSKIASLAEEYIVIWDVENSEELIFLYGEGVAFCCCDWSLDGTLICAGCQDGTMFIWETVAGTVINKKQIHKSQVNDCCFHPTQRKIASVSDDKTALIWDFNSNESKLLYGHKKRVIGCTWSPNGKRLVTSSDDARLLIWNSETGKKKLDLKSFMNHLGAAGRCLWPEHQSIYSYGEVLSIWDIESGTHKETLINIKRELLNTLACVLDLKANLVASYIRFENKIYIWKLKTKRVVYICDCSSSSTPTWISFSHDSKKMAVVYLDGSIHIWHGIDLYESTVGSIMARSVDSHFNLKHFLNSVVVVKKLYNLSKNSDKNYIETIKLLGAINSLSIYAEDNGVVVSALSNDGTQLAYATYSGNLNTVELVSGKVRTRHKTKNELILCIAWSPDDTLISTGLSDGTVKIISSTNGKVVQKIKFKTELTWIEWTLDLKKVIVGTKRGLIIYDLCQKREIKSEIDELTITGKISPDGQYIAVSTEIGHVLLIAVNTGKKVRRLKFKTPISFINWSAYREDLVCVKDNGIFTVIDLSAKKSRGTFGDKNSIDWESRPVDEMKAIIKAEGNYLSETLPENVLTDWEALKQHTPVLTWILSHIHTTISCFFIDAEHLIVSNWRDRSLSIWDMQNRKNEACLYLDFIPHAVQWVPESRILVVVDGLHRHAFHFQLLIP